MVKVLLLKTLNVLKIKIEFLNIYLMIYNLWSAYDLHRFYFRRLVLTLSHKKDWKSFKPELL